MQGFRNTSENLRDFLRVTSCPLWLMPFPGVQPSGIIGNLDWHGYCKN